MNGRILVASWPTTPPRCSTYSGGIRRAPGMPSPPGPLPVRLPSLRERARATFCPSPRSSGARGGCRGRVMTSVVGSFAWLAATAEPATEQEQQPYDATFDLRPRRRDPAAIGPSGWARGQRGERSSSGLSVPADKGRERLAESAPRPAAGGPVRAAPPSRRTSRGARLCRHVVKEKLPARSLRARRRLLGWSHNGVRTVLETTHGTRAPP